jgi:predicted CxxxxCH...CXXCH cytochrome family protein
MRITSFAILAVFGLSLTACFPAKPGVGDDSGPTEGDADTDTDADTDVDSHGEGWNHGLAAKHQTEDCQACHGEDLTGGSSGISCDTCHPSGWRTDCTFCHGGVDDQTGAPPEDMDDASTGVSFPEHATHLDGDSHHSWSCEQCHVEHAGIFDAGHIFDGDDTPAVAEVTMAGGLSAQGSYAGSGGCSNLYCHGDGERRGDAQSGQSTDCGDCHGDARSPRQLSGRHDDHMDEGLHCEDCHGDTVSGDDRIVGPQEHVDGEVDVVIRDLNYNGRTCDGTCHNERHSNESWEGGGDDDDGDDD